MEDPSVRIRQALERIEMAFEAGRLDPEEAMELAGFVSRVLRLRVPPQGAHDAARIARLAEIGVELDDQ